jgi:hypothetical protein
VNLERQIKGDLLKGFVKKQAPKGL